jgi:hypothetical protein
MITSNSSEHPTELPTSKRIIGFINKPGYLLLSTVGTIFLLEALVMLLLIYSPPINSYQEMFIDASLLSLIIFPVLYFLIFRPLRIHIDLRRKAEAEKDALIVELHKALDEVKILRGLIPICASCKNIRDDNGFWQQLEVYISAHSDAQFSHGICPECTRELYPELEQDVCNGSKK